MMIDDDFLVLSPMRNWLTLDNNRKVTNWILTGISPWKIKPLDPSLAPIMSHLDNLANSIKFNNCVLGQKILA